MLECPSGLERIFVRRSKSKVTKSEWGGGTQGLGETARSEEAVGRPKPRKAAEGQRGGPYMWLYSSSHPLGSLARNQQCPGSIMKTLVSQNEHVPKLMGRSRMHLGSSVCLFICTSSGR